MNRVGVLAVVILMVAALGLLPTPAEAACSQGGTIVSVFVQPGGSITNIYLRNSNQAATGIVWVATTTDAKMVSAALSALNGLTRVAMVGNAAACPAAGATRLMGVALLISLAP